jgi:hypothetical protein
VIQALIQAGCPREVFSYYPTDHAGSGEILRHCGRGIVFGDATSTGLWQGDPRIEIHGPGFSKIVIGEDCIEDWEEYLTSWLPRFWKWRALLYQLLAIWVPAQGS